MARIASASSSRARRGSGELGAGFTVAFVLGCVVSVLAISRRSLFVAGVQPPMSG